MNENDDQHASNSTERFLAKLEGDEEYQRALAEQDVELDRQEGELARAEQPLTDDLHADGVNVESVWELGPSTSHPKALPVLIQHFERGGYPDLTTNRIGQALSVRAAVVYWDRLKALYLAPRGPAEEEAAAIALAGCAGTAQLDDLVHFVDLEERGDSRVYFLRPIRRIGRERGRAVLEGLRKDPVLGTEATVILEGRGRNS